MARYCGTCGRIKRSPGEKRQDDDDHESLLEGLPKTCNMEFTIMEDGERRPAVAASLDEGFQRNSRNEAAWVHASRLEEDDQPMLISAMDGSL